MSPFGSSFVAIVALASAPAAAAQVQPKKDLQELEPVEITTQPPQTVELKQLDAA